jgi:hypothetical protein
MSLSRRTLPAITVCQQVEFAVAIEIAEVGGNVGVDLPVRAGDCAGEDGVLATSLVDSQSTLTVALVASSVPSARVTLTVVPVWLDQDQAGAGSQTALPRRPVGLPLTPDETNQARIVQLVEKLRTLREFQSVS